MKNVTLLVGPSGVGKTTFEELLKTLNPNLATIISAANRPKRVGEVDGINYYFTDESVNSVISRKDDFVKLLTFLEDENMKHLFYGVEKKQLQKQLIKSDELIYSIIDVDLATHMSQYLKKQEIETNIDVLYFQPPKEIIIDFLLKRLNFNEKTTLELKDTLLNNKDIKQLDVYNILDDEKKMLLELPYRLDTIENKLMMMRNEEQHLEEITGNKIIKLQTPDSYFQEYSTQKELNLVDNRKISSPLKDMVAELVSITRDELEIVKDFNDGQGKIRTLLINIGNVIRNNEFKEYFIQSSFIDFGLEKKEKVINTLLYDMNITKFYNLDLDTIKNKITTIVNNFYEDLKKEHTPEELRNGDLLVMYYIDKAKESNAKIICTDCRMPQELEEFSKSAPVYLVLREFKDNNAKSYAKFYDKDDNQLNLQNLINAFKSDITYEELVNTLNKKFNVDRTEALGMILSVDAFNQKNKQEINPLLEKELSVLRAKTFPLFIPNATNQEKYVDNNREMIESVLSSSQIVLMGVAKAGKDHTLKMLEKALYKFKNENKEMENGNIISIKPENKTNSSKVFFIEYRDSNNKHRTLPQFINKEFLEDCKECLKKQGVILTKNNVEFINSMLEYWDFSVQSKVELSKRNISIIDFVDDGETKKDIIFDKINLVLPITIEQEKSLREYLKMELMMYKNFDNTLEEIKTSIKSYLNENNIKYEQPYFSASIVQNKNNKGFEVEIIHPNGFEIETKVFDTLKIAEQTVNKINKTFCETWEDIDKLTKPNQEKTKHLKINEEIDGNNMVR